VTLWAVRVGSRDQTLTTVFAAVSREEAAESAGRINDWVHHMDNEHPGESPGVVADVIEWPTTAEEHAQELAQLQEMIEAVDAEDEG
jgi:hypothetical protein